MENVQNSLLRKPEPLQVKIIDSIMGTGKTSWAIQYMNEAPSYKKFIYITPFKTEVERVIASCKDRIFVQPENKKGGTKLASLKNYILNGKDIVSTHALFQRMDSGLIELIKAKGYSLILDEAMNVIEQEKISKDDLQLLLSATNKVGEPLIIVDKNGFVQWNDSDYKEGQFTKIRNLAEANNLMIYDNVAMYWTFPVEAFKAFEEVYVLTYMFDGQIQRYYYDLFKVRYAYHSVGTINGKYELIPYVPLHKENKAHLKELINIFYSTTRDKTDLNKIGEGRYAFSVSKLEGLIKDNHLKKLIKDNAYNFYRHKCKANSNDVMWTTFLGDKDAIKKAITPKNLKKQFVSVTMRATNDYADKSVCIYLANMFMNPIIKRFFTSKGVEVNQDLFALSELLQWVFRSRVRKGEKIQLYIPSERMRTLLEQYLNNETIGQR
ncbi:DEAD/DEAH box helicase family protein [Bacillus cereus]|uniref:DEAD/DEAH box helicase family protein n=1 Tax=Bacillus cereus group TaxID=86661 RepID=UPI000676C4A2|nr:MULTISPECIES: DEAD/DEAH box helicase family protein [Bacillus cereus group]AKR34233.1 SPBc2 prophage-derived protein YonV [Bacillus thuringiensis serovar indiana]MBG9645228.1 hypothetical protein [Bacillus thuringiensis]MBG9651264.1 hypothetical protein [Bacillus thuringiensis]MEB8878107.1 DEAD/DEAH box helicase family protein [Bacillus cereus]MEB9616717.1 DEAD/DEAH box helicase family protein [Bacillus cereus]